MDRKRILWTVALFAGCYILFRGIDAAAKGSDAGVSLGIRAAAAVIIVVIVILIVRRRS
ncbi:MAG: hypothetical protein ACR2LK_02955 [Solirubrobacteraceae bacterium]